MRTNLASVLILLRGVHAAVAGASSDFDIFTPIKSKWLWSQRPELPSGLLAALVIGRDEHVLLWEFLEHRSRLTEVGRQHVDRVAGHPFRQVDLLVHPRVEPDQHAARLLTHVLNGVPV